MQTCEITGEWIGFNSPEQNTHVESVIGTLKQDWIWCEEYDTFDKVLKLCQRTVKQNNCDHPHSSLEMLSPNEFTRLVNEGRVKITENQTVEILPKAAQNCLDLTGPPHYYGIHIVQHVLTTYNEVSENSLYFPAKTKKIDDTPDENG